MAKDINIGLGDKERDKVIALLNVTLADLFVLYTKTRRYHWNVSAVNFSQLHTLFETQYTALEMNIDATAERIRSVGGYPMATLAEYAKSTRLSEEGEDKMKAEKMLKNLLTDYETMIRNIRTDITTADDKLGDVGTADFLTGILGEFEKTAWMLRAYME